MGWGPQPFHLGLVLPVLGLAPWAYGVYYGSAYKRPAVKDEESVSSMGDSEKLEQLAARHGLPTEEEYFAYFCLSGVLAETPPALAITSSCSCTMARSPALSHTLAAILPIAGDSKRPPGWGGRAASCSVVRLAFPPRVCWFIWFADLI